MLAKSGPGHLPPDLRHLRLGLRAFHEDHVGAGLGVHAAAADRLLQPQSGARIRPRDDEEVGALARLNRDADLEDHFLRRDDAAAGRVAALLRHLLVFELDGGDARRLVARDRVAHVQQPAIAGVGIGDQRRAAAPRDGPHAGDHVV
jgi:hypothetical protein